MLVLIRRRANIGVFSETGKGGADRLTGKIRDAVELALGGIAVDLIEEI